jgi:hypothetical protein
VQPAQFRGWLDTQLLHQRRAQLLVHRQRLGLAAAPVQRQHPQRPEPFPQRMLGGQRL